MIVSPLVHDALLYGSIATAVGAVVVFYVRDAPARVPTATARGGAAAAARRWIVRIAPWPALVCGAVAAVWISTQSRELIVVTDDGARPSARRVIEMGHAPESDGDVCVVNRSTHTVRVETVPYGIALYGGEPTYVPPGTTCGFRAIDDIGPDHPPPQSVTDRAGLHMDSRYWLTWD